MAYNRIGEGMSVSEFAKTVGVSQPYISKLLAKKKLPRNKDGTIPPTKGLAAYRALKGLSDNAFTKEKTDAEVDRENEKIIVTESDEKPKKRQYNTDFGQSFQESDAEKVKISDAYKKAMLAEKTFNAKIKEIEYRVKKGEVFELEEAKRSLRDTAVNIKMRLLSIPPRVSVLCEKKNAREIEQLLEAEITDALRELAKSRFLTEETEEEQQNG